MNQQAARNRSFRWLLVAGLVIVLGIAAVAGMWLHVAYPRLIVRSAARETDAGRPIGAVRRLCAVLTKRPHLVEAYRELARAYGLLGYHQAAIEALKAAAALEPDGATQWHDLGMSFLLSGDEAGAVWALEHLSNCKGGAPLADAIAARLALREAFHAARSALLQLQDNQSSDTSFRAARYLARLQFAQAHEALSSHGDESVAARLERGAQSLERATSLLQQAVEATSDPEIHEILAAICMDAGRFDEAAVHCAALPPDSRSALLCTAMLNLRRGAVQSDSTLLARLQDLAPRSLSARALLVEDALSAEQETLALKEAKLATAESLWHGRSRYLEGRRALSAEQPNAAVLALQAAVGEHPHWLAPLYWRAIAGTTIDRSNAIQHLRTILERRPHLLRARLTLARICLEESAQSLEIPPTRAHLLQSALDHATLALAADPSDITAGRLMALTQAELHEYPEAERQYYRLVLQAAGQPAEAFRPTAPYIDGLDVERVLSKFSAPLSTSSDRVAELDRSCLKAFVSLTAGKPAEAAQALTRVLGRYTIPFLHLELARAHALAGDLEKAANALSDGAGAAARRDLPAGTFYLELARVRWAQDNAPEALAEFLRALQEQDCPKEAYRDLASLLMSLLPALESPKERVAFLKPLNELAPLLLPSRTRETIQQNVDRETVKAAVDMALTALVEAELSLPDEAPLRVLRARLALLLGHIRPASEQFEAALRLDPGFAPAYQGIVLRLVRARFQLGDFLKIISGAPAEAAPLLQKWRQVESGLRRYLDDTLKIISKSQDFRPASADLALCRVLALQMIQLAKYHQTGAVDMESVLPFTAEATAVDGIATWAAIAHANLLHITSRVPESARVLQLHPTFSAMSRVMGKDFLNRFSNVYRALEPGQQRTLPFGVCHDLPLVLLATRYSLHDAGRELLDAELKSFQDDDALVNYVLATRDLLTGRLPQAEARYTMLAERYPDLADVQVLLARAALKERRPEDAVSAYRAAISLDDHHRSALLELATVLLQQNRAPEALACLERVLELARQEPDEPLYRDADWLTAPSTDTIEEFGPLVHRAKVYTAGGTRQERVLRMLMILEGKTPVPPVEWWRILLRTLDRASLRMWIAAEYENVGEPDKALTHCRGALEEHPSANDRRIILEAIRSLQTPQ